MDALHYRWDLDGVTSSTGTTTSSNTVNIWLGPVPRPLSMRVRHFIRGLKAGWLLYSVFGLHNKSLWLCARAALNSARREWRYGIPDIHYPEDDEL